MGEQKKTDTQLWVSAYVVTREGSQLKTLFRLLLRLANPSNLHVQDVIHVVALLISNTRPLLLVVVHRLLIV